MSKISKIYPGIPGFLGKPGLMAAGKTAGPKLSLPSGPTLSADALLKTTAAEVAILNPAGITNLVESEATQAFTIEQTLSWFGRKQEKIVARCENFLKSLPKVCPLPLTKMAQSRLEKEKSILTAAQARINSIKTKMGNQPTVWKFAEAIREMEDALPAQLEKHHQLVVDCLRQESDRFPQLKFDPRQLFFIPESSWLRTQIFNKPGRNYGFCYPVSDGQNTLNLYFVLYEVENPMKIISIVAHETTHPGFREWEKLITQNPRIFWLGVILSEAVVEEERRKITEDICRKHLKVLDPKLHRQMAALAQTKKKPGIQHPDLLELSLAIYKEYLEESIFYKRILAIYGEEGRQAVRSFLVEGNPEPLQNLFGQKNWDVLLDFTSEIRTGNFLGPESPIYRLGHAILLEALEHPKERKARLACGLRTFKVISQTLVPSFDDNPKPEIEKSEIENRAAKLLYQKLFKGEIKSAGGAASFYRKTLEQMLQRKTRVTEKFREIKELLRSLKNA